MAMPQTPDKKTGPLQEIIQPFIDLVQAPRALWGINLAYFLEGWVYFGMLGYLAMHFSDFIFQGVPNPDVHSHHMVMVLTAGITISMFFLGSVADKKGIRWTLLTAFGFLLFGRIGTGCQDEFELFANHRSLARYQRPNFQPVLYWKVKADIVFISAGLFHVKH